MKYPALIKVIFNDDFIFPDGRWIPFDDFVKLCIKRQCDFNREAMLGAPDEDK